MNRSLTRHFKDTWYLSFIMIIIAVGIIIKYFLSELPEDSQKADSPSITYEKIGNEIDVVVEEDIPEVNNNDMGFDIDTFGERHPDLENEIFSLMAVSASGAAGWNSH